MKQATLKVACFIFFYSMNGMNMQISSAPTSVLTPILRQLRNRLLRPVRIGVATQMMATILKVLIDAVAVRFAALCQGQLRRIRGEEAHPGEAA